MAGGDSCRDVAELRETDEDGALAGDRQRPRAGDPRPPATQKVTGGDEKSIVDEVERGEDYLKDKFETALNSGTLSGQSRSVVEQCFQSVKQGHDQMSQLKHGMESANS